MEKQNELAVEAEARGVKFKIGARGGTAIAAVLGGWLLWLLWLLM